MKTLKQILKSLENSSEINLFVIDLFCGAGGLSEGFELAKVSGQKCSKVVACINHDKNAIYSHEANIPDALHFIEDIRTVSISPIVELIEKIRELYPESKILLHASLECTNFSKAKGGQPRDADSRTLAEHLFRYINAIDPDYITIENVEEFMSWGDMDENGKPISKDKGRCYRRWVNDVKKYGYNFEHRIMNAADHGSYTSRKRFFGIFAKNGLPIAFPEPTHCKGGKQDMFSKLSKWKAVKEVLDFSDEGESIFRRKKPLVDPTLIRTYSGLIKFVAGGKNNFLIKYNSMSRTKKYNAPGTDQPCPVVSTQNRLGVVQAQFLASYYGNGDNCSSVDKPSPTVTTKDRISIVQTKFIDQQYGQSKPSSVNKPLGAITTNPKYNLVSCQPWIMNTNFQNIGSSIDQPAQTITANRKWHYLMNPQFASVGGSVDLPCFTLIARMDKMPPYLMEASTSTNNLPSFIKEKNGVLIYEIYKDDSEIMVKIKEFMAIYGIVDIKMRMLRIKELKLIMGFPEDYVLIGTQADQKKFIGNAVEVNMAKVLCEALCSRLIKTKEIAA